MPSYNNIFLFILYNPNSCYRRKFASILTRTEYMNLMVSQAQQRSCAKIPKKKNHVFSSIKKNIFKTSPLSVEQFPTYSLLKICLIFHLLKGKLITWVTPTSLSQLNILIVTSSKRHLSPSPEKQSDLFWITYLPLPPWIFF